jgi:hypothetical protein
VRVIALEPRTPHQPEKLQNVSKNDLVFTPSNFTVKQKGATLSPSKSMECSPFTGPCANLVQSFPGHFRGARTCRFFLSCDSLLGWLLQAKNDFRGVEISPSASNHAAGKNYELARGVIYSTAPIINHPMMLRAARRDPAFSRCTRTPRRPRLGGRASARLAVASGVAESQVERLIMHFLPRSQAPRQPVPSRMPVAELRSAGQTRRLPLRTNRDMPPLLT